MKVLGAMFVGLAVFAMGCAGTSAGSRSVQPTVRLAAAVPPGDMGEAASCGGVRDHVVGKGFFTGLEVVAIEPVERKQFIGARNFVSRTAGADVVVLATPTHHSEWLDRLARCYVDSYAMTGHSPGDDPLSVPGAKYEIRPAAGGYAIRVTADDLDAAREIRARAARLERQPHASR